MEKIRKFILIILASLFLLPGCNVSTNTSQNSDDNHISNSQDNSSSSEKEDVDLNETVLDNLHHYVADIANAKSLGIKKKSNKNSNKSARKTANEEINVLVKKEDEIAGNEASLREDGTVEVKFTNISTKTKLQDIDKTTYVIARANDKENVNIISIDTGSVVVQSNHKYEYRLLIDEVVYEDWKHSDYSTISFDITSLCNEDRNKIIIESRSIDALIKIPLYSEFKYEIYDNKNILVKEFTADKNVEENESISLYGFIEGETYLVKYSGKGTIEEIEQSEIGAHVDKLCVVDDFTFVSFIPNSYTPGIVRNNEEYLNVDAEIDNEGDFIYDKTDYFDSKDRRSFIIDNRSGLIYSLNDVKVDSIHNGLFKINGSNLIYDIRITNENEVEFYPLYNNDSIEVFEYMKDKYGNCYIVNLQLDTYNEATNTTFVKLSSATNYCLTESREVIFVAGPHNSIQSVLIYNEDRQLVEISKYATFKVMRNNSRNIVVNSTCYGHEMVPYLVKNGYVYCCDFENDAEFPWIYGYGHSPVVIFNLETKTTSNITLYSISVDTYFLEKYGVLLCYDGSGTIVAVYGINDITDGSFSLQSAMGAFDAFKGYAECEVIIENCQIDAPDYDITTYGVDGNIYWELFAEETADGCKIVPHIEGTYFPQNVGSVVLKPLQ
jgi:hypothetical protein